MGIREAFYITFSYKEIRLCLAIGLAMLIVTGYGVQVGAGRSSQDGRRRTVGIQREASSSQRPAASAGRSASRRPAARYGGQRPTLGMAVKHHSFLICFAPPPDFIRPTTRFPKCPLTLLKLSTGPNRGLSHLAVDKAVSSL